MLIEQTDPRIILIWLTRLRWLAVGGQLAAALTAEWWLGLHLDLAWIGSILAATFLTNGLVHLWLRFGEPPSWMVPAVILLDVILLTLLLYATGGSRNPFSLLYVVHVAIAVVASGALLAWIVAGISMAAVGAMHWWFVPLGGRSIPDGTLQLGRWVALALVSTLIAYFVGRVVKSMKEREMELGIMREKAGRGARLASLTTLAAGAAHELGTPLGTIALAARELEIAAERGAQDPAIVEDARLIRQEVDRCRAILNRMRVDVVSDISQQAARAPLRQLIDQFVEDLRPGEAERLVIGTQPAESAEITRPGVIRRAVGVLLRNSFDASPPTGVVRLDISRRHDSTTYTVSDKGIGMAEEVLRRAGEPFFTTKPPGAGMGLGLYLVRLVADTYGGRFELRSVPGGGTVSVLELPE